MECESKRYTGNNRGDWNHLRITEKIPEIIKGKHEIKDLQKPAILCTAHKLREVLLLRYRTYFRGEIILRVAQIVLRYIEL